jgi:type IV pilus assembly protein PilW
MNARSRQTGFTLVEILIALLIGLFLAAGLVKITQHNKSTYSNQTNLSQLQDNQRFALSVLNDVIQAAGYYPDPTQNVAATDMPVNASFPNFVAGQPLYGVHTSTTVADSITVQFSLASNDTTLNCDGTSNTGGQNAFFNTFSVVADASGNPMLSKLMCQVGTNAAVTLVTGVTNLQVYYGINNVGSTVTHDVTEYKNATQMGATDWMNVTSVRVDVSFANPLYYATWPNPPPLGQPQNITVTRIIGVMMRVGVTT